MMEFIKVKFMVAVGEDSVSRILLKLPFPNFKKINLDKVIGRVFRWVKYLE